MRSQREIEEQLQRMEGSLEMTAAELFAEELHGAYTSSRFEEATDTLLRLQGAIAALNWVVEHNTSLQLPQ